MSLVSSRAKSRDLGGGIVPPARSFAVCAAQDDTRIGVITLHDRETINIRAEAIEIMRYLFDMESNSLAVTFAEGRHYRDSMEIADGVVVDFDTEGRPYSIEFLRADQVLDVRDLATEGWTELKPR